MKIKHWIIAISILILILLPAPAVSVAKSNSNRVFNIRARSFEYTPSVIHVQQGDRVKLTMTADDVTHGLILDYYDVELVAAPRPEKESSVEFIADRAGKFRFRCTQVCGPLHPFMVGELIVEPNALGTLSFPLLLIVAGGTLGLLWVGKSRPGMLPEQPWRFELTKFRIVRWFVDQRWFQYSLMLPNLFFFVIIMLAAFFGTPVGNANFAIIFVWIVWWAALKLILIPLGGRSWCSMCPIPAPGEWIDHRAFIKKGNEKPLAIARKNWPKQLRNLWTQNATFLAVALFSAIILTRPWATGVVLLAFFIGAIILSYVYGRRIFCRYVCPVSGFIALYSMAAPVEVRVKDPDLCRKHVEKDCVCGNESGYGCPWMEYPGNLKRNAYCGLCTECLKTCPKNNVGLNLRPFGSDLFIAQGRGVDEVYNVFIMLTCAMVYSAVYLGSWGVLKDWANIATIPGFLFYTVLFLAANLVVVPGLFYLAVWLGKAWADQRLPSRQESLAILEPLAPVPGQIAQFVRGFARRSRPAIASRAMAIQAMDAPVQRPVALTQVAVASPTVATKPVQPKPAPASALPPLKQLFVDYGYALAPLGLTGWIAFTVSFALIDISYAIPLLSDPFGWGWNLFGTAGTPWIRFIPEWVPYIQTPILLIGMALSIVTAYKIIEQRVADKKLAFQSVLPVVVFMVVVMFVFFQLYV
ncbi:MAG: 4Fe-4S binding protein [Chloroflexi bacterium]|nr:4Fe-4S binding protein [Chloroflexota bacterium]